MASLSIRPAVPQDTDLILRFMREDCGRFEWSVLDWNTPSIQFYESLQAKPQSEWVRYRLTGQALQDLARQAVT